jgi:glycosyltransferase involved in cell wall biosynthesis
MPSISVVLSVFNGEAYLQNAIESILSQTFTDFEFIIVNDGSTDKTVSIIESFRDRRIKLLDQKNTGLATALNNGISLTNSPYIARMDADDISMPDRLRLQYNYMLQNKDCVVCGTWAHIIDQEGNFVYTKKTIVNNEQIKIFLLKGQSKNLPNTPFLHSSVMFKVDAFKQIGGYTEYMRRAQDVVLFNKMLNLGSFHNLPIPLLEYRVVPTAIGGNKMRPILLGEILTKAINNQTVNAELLDHLKSTLKTRNDIERQYSYNLFLGKKFLWDNYNPVKSRAYLMKAIKHKPGKLIAWQFYIASLVIPKIFFIHFNNENKQ